MTTTITVKGQVTLPKAVRDAAGLEARRQSGRRGRTASGGVYIEKPGKAERISQEARSDIEASADPRGEAPMNIMRDAAR